jgi:hypothetical protein
LTLPKLVLITRKRRRLERWLEALETNWARHWFKMLWIAVRTQSSS